MGFANSSLFANETPGEYKPFESLSTMRGRFVEGTKVMIAIGGWGDTAGFSEGSKDDASRSQYAKNVAEMLEKVGADGVGMFENFVPQTHF